MIDTHRSKFASRSPSFNAESITATIERALGSAGLQTRAGPLQGVTETIRRALSSAGIGTGTGPAAVPDDPAIDDSVIDVEAREVGGPRAEPTRRGRARPSTEESVAPGLFTTHQFSNQAGSRAYKLYVPTCKPGAPMPLVVMLHGCKQSPDDFAAGTQMNRLAEQHGFLVVYPEQAARANGSNCWNWFNRQDQLRGGGEPSLIAGIAREVAANHPVDPQRIFVAGLSAGAAMSVILGETYPELFAGVGAHSGLPYGAAHDVPSAFAAMARGRSSAMPGASTPLGAAASARPQKAAQFVPTIVFHGDRDQTVGQGNGAEIVRQACSALQEDTRLGGSRAPVAVTRNGVAPSGRSFSQTVYSLDKDRPCVESWLVHGAGHAWSGGSASGSYTDASGPDASAEMIRFFLAQLSAGAA